MECETHVADELITCSREVSRRLSNASLRVDTPRATHNLSRLDRKWQFRKTLSHAFHDTDYPMTIYGHSRKPRHMLSMTLTIQRPYMAIQENVVACLPWH